MIGSTDAGLANFGELTAYPSPVNTSADTSTYGASFVLFDNLWGTNYVEWWPFQVPNLTLTRPNLTLALTIHPFKYRSILPSIHSNIVEWWPFQVPPPAQYAASSQYFPSSWNNVSAVHKQWAGYTAT